MDVAKSEIDSFALLRDFTARLQGGKRVGTDIYFHLTYPGVVQFLQSLQKIELAPEANVARFGVRRDRPSISLLSYRSFFEVPFPELQWSAHFDLTSGKITRRTEGANPAILHRKELLLAEGAPNLASYVHLTEQLVAEKLLPADAFVGRRDHWNSYLGEKGFCVLNGQLARLNSR